MNPYIVGAIVAGLVVSHGALYVKGRSDGSTSVTQRLASDRIVILEDGKRIDAEALSADDLALCGLLGSCSVPDAGSQ